MISFLVSLLIYFYSYNFSITIMYFLSLNTKDKISIHFSLLYFTILTIVNVKQSLNRLRWALTVPGSWGSKFQDTRHKKVVRLSPPTHRPPLSSRKYSWYSFLLEAESTPVPQCGRNVYVSEKNSMKPTEIEPATFRLVA